MIRNVGLTKNFPRSKTSCDQRYTQGKRQAQDEVGAELTLESADGVVLSEDLDKGDMLIGDTTQSKHVSFYLKKSGLIS